VICLLELRADFKQNQPLHSFRPPFEPFSACGKPVERLEEKAKKTLKRKNKP